MKRATFWALVATALLTTACALPPGKNTKSDEQMKAEESANMITPMTEKRETLVATGYAVISIQNHRNPSQHRLLAIRASKLDAYRALTEQVYGQQLDANTTIADMTVINPFDFFLEPQAETWPFTYDASLAEEIAQRLEIKP